MKIRRAKDELMQIAGYMVEITTLSPSGKRGNEWWINIELRALARKHLKD